MFGLSIPGVPKLSAILFGCILVLALVAGVQSWRLNRALLDLDDAHTELNTAHTAVRLSQAHVVMLEEAVQRWQALATPQAPALAAASRAAARAKLIEERADQIKRNEVTDLERTDCDKLLNTDIGSVCPAIADGVRARAGDGLSRPTGAGAGAGGETHPGPID